MNRLILLLLSLMLASTAIAITPPSGEVLIEQKNREFSVSEMSVDAGTMLLFSNADDFPHQISAQGPGVAMVSPLQRTGEVLTVRLPEQGVVQVRCGIHPRMRLTLKVN
jgi:plastocyanin